MRKIRLGVNIDHVATIRNARGSEYPDPLSAALIVKKCGANSVTIHLREDRRHIKDFDLRKIKKKLKLPLNLEMAPTTEMLKIAIKHKPEFVCIVPEKRKEITTEGGLNISRNIKIIRKIVNQLKKHKIRISFFIEPNINDIKLSKLLGVSCVELHTGNYCNQFKNKKKSKKAYYKLKKAALFAKRNGLEVHAGHGLNYSSAHKISKIKNISELNIGHFIISESIFNSLPDTIKKFKRIINK